jgi:hypothetical protein
MLLPLNLESESRWMLSLRGAGPVRIGMSLGNVRRALADSSARLEGNGPDDDVDNCAYLNSRRLPKGVSLMFAKGKVVRIDIDQGPIKTASGAGIGDTEQRIFRLYPGRIQVEGHHYDPSGHYLNYLTTGSVDRELGMVFETDGKKVTSFRTGTLAAIALVEGCS